MGTAGKDGGSSPNQSRQPTGLLPDRIKKILKKVDGKIDTALRGKGGTGGRGGDGSALGGAVLVLDGIFQSKLNLWNVDFIQNTAHATEEAKKYNQIYQKL